MKILIVDDESIVLDSCRRVLEAEGFQVFLASSADKALEIMASMEPALVLIDVKMPVLDGIDLMREIRKTWLDIPIILMSGYSTRETISQAAVMGAATFIPKPFTPDELLEKVHRVIDMEILPVFSQKRGKK